MTSHLVNHTVVLTPTGHLREGQESDALERTIEDLLSRGARALLVNLSEATLLSARVVGILASAHHELERLGGRLALACVSDTHRWVLGVAGLTGVLHVFETEEQAIEMLEGARVKVA